jgi:hypothetical protein
MVGREAAKAVPMATRRRASVGLAVRGLIRAKIAAGWDS